MSGPRRAVTSTTCATASTRPCSRRASGRWATANWRSGFWQTGCRCGCSCSCTSSSGKTRQDTDPKFDHDPEFRRESRAVSDTAEQQPAQPTEQGKRAVVLVSGGLDSTTCLAIARSQGYAIYALSFDYGQRASSELQAAREVAASMSVVQHHVIPLGIGALGGSALTDSTLNVPEQESEGIPVTYVPARNTVFLSYALALVGV